MVETQLLIGGLIGIVLIMLRWVVRGCNDRHQDL